MRTNRISSSLLMLAIAIAKENTVRVEVVLLGLLTSVAGFIKAAKIQPQGQPTVLWSMNAQPSATNKVYI